MKRILMTGCFVVLLMGGAKVNAQQCRTVTFAAGRTSTTVTGSTGNTKSACYKIHARSGQRLTAHLTSADRRARFSIGPDEYDADFLSGAENTADWEGELTDNSGKGNFLIMVSTSRAGANFTLELAIPAGVTSTISSHDTAPTSAATCGNFSGVYETNYGPLKLTRTGDQVRGVYTTDSKGDSTLEGTVRGNVMTGKWREPSAKGTFRFDLNRTGRSFTGRFSPDQAPTESGEWNGHCPQK